MKDKSVNTGWVIVSEKGTIHRFTFKLTRKSCVERYVSLFSKMNWKSHYNRGVRCVKAKQTTELI